MPIDFKNRIHIAATTGEAITLRIGETRTVSKALRSAFAAKVAEGELDGVIEGDTICVPDKSNKEAPVDTERLSQIVAALKAIAEEGREDELTSKGKPKVEAINQRVGFLTDPGERDQAFALLADDEAE